MPTVSLLGLDENGVAEDRVVAWDFKNFPEIIAGATLQSSPVPVIQVVTPSGAATPTFSTPAISGTQVQSQVSLTGGTAGVKYNTVCRAYLSGTTWLYCYGDLFTIGPS